MIYSVVYREQISLEISSAISNQDKIKYDIAKVRSKIDVIINFLVKIIDSSCFTYK